jgi:hypothetical protein
LHSALVLSGGDLPGFLHFLLHNKFLRWQKDHLPPIVSNIIQFNYAEKGVKI